MAKDLFNSGQCPCVHNQENTKQQWFVFHDHKKKATSPQWETVVSETSHGQARRHLEQCKAKIDLAGLNENHSVPWKENTALQWMTFTVTVKYGGSIKVWIFWIESVISNEKF